MRVLAIFILAVFLMGFHLITTRYHARDLYVQIEQLRGQAEDLDAQWRRLQLERAELTRNARIDELARENFSMAPAGPEHTIYLPAGQIGRASCRERVQGSDERVMRRVE